MDEKPDSLKDAIEAMEKLIIDEELRARLLGGTVVVVAVVDAEMIRRVREARSAWLRRN